MRELHHPFLAYGLSYWFSGDVHSHTTGLSSQTGEWGHKGNPVPDNPHLTLSVKPNKTSDMLHVYVVLVDGKLGDNPEYERIVDTNATIAYLNAKGIEGV